MFDEHREFPGSSSFRATTRTRKHEPAVRPWKVERSALARAINLGGRVLAPIGVNLLDEDRLLDAARRQTGLDDFGDPSFREPLRRLLESLESEARLNALGKMATRYDVLRLLINRLRMEKDRKENPGIAGEAVRRPVIITGLPRTGTTLLHALLALDPAARAPLTWETVFPSPPPERETYRVDRRIDIVGGRIRWFKLLVKGFDRIHPVGATLPEECLVIFGHSFRSYQFETTHRVPSYLDWLESEDLRPAYAEHRRFLQHLQWRCPGERWVLKAPAHLFDLGALFSTYPDARVVMTHRDPVEVAASNASLTATLRGAFSDAVDPREVGPESSRRWAGAMERALRFRDGGRAPAGSFLDLYYDDLVADPAGTVRKVYAAFDLPFPEGMERAIGDHLRKNPKDRHGRHLYTLEQFGLSREGEMRRYAAYRERFRL